EPEGCGTFLRASKYPFDNTIEDVTRRLLLREHEFANLDIGPAHRPVTRPPASLAPVERLAEGFWSISGAAVDRGGELYFIDRHFQRIHRWTDARGLEVVRDQPLDAVNLAFDASGHLLVLSSLGPKGAVFWF